MTIRQLEMLWQISSVTCYLSYFSVIRQDEINISNGFMRHWPHKSINDWFIYVCFNLYFHECQHLSYGFIYIYFMVCESSRPCYISDSATRKYGPWDICVILVNVWKSHDETRNVRQERIERLVNLEFKNRREW